MESENIPSNTTLSMRVDVVFCGEKYRIEIIAGLDYLESVIKHFIAQTYSGKVAPSVLLCGLIT